MQNLEEKYEVQEGTEISTYEFVSTGRKGEISKLVQYKQLDINNFYNLGFGDKNEFGEIDDKVILTNSIATT